MDTIRALHVVFKSVAEALCSRNGKSRIYSTGESPEERALMQTNRKSQTYRVLFSATLLAALTACGSDNSANSVTKIDVHCSKINGHFVSDDAQADVTFGSGNTFVTTLRACTSSGTYSCDSNNDMVMNVNITASNSCQVLGNGNYNCTISTAGQFLIFGCTGADPDYLNPPRNFTVP